MNKINFWKTLEIAFQKVQGLKFYSFYRWFKVLLCFIIRNIEEDFSNLLMRFIFIFFHLTLSPHFPFKPKIKTTNLLMTSHRSEQQFPISENFSRKFWTAELLASTLRSINIQILLRFNSGSKIQIRDFSKKNLEFSSLIWLYKFSNSSKKNFLFTVFSYCEASLTETETKLLSRDAFSRIFLCFLDFLQISYLRFILSLNCYVSKFKFNFWLHIQFCMKEYICWDF